MKVITTCLFLLIFSFASTAQFVAKVQMKDSIEGICDHDNVYSLFDGFDGQVSAECSVSKNQMEKQLNEELTFLKEHPKFKGKGMIGFFINCEGEVVQCDIDNETGKPELDAEILRIFQTYTEWKHGTFNGKAVDTHELFSYEIKKGKIRLN